MAHALSSVYAAEGFLSLILTNTDGTYADVYLPLG